MPANQTLWQRLEHALRRPRGSVEIFDRTRSALTPTSTALTSIDSRGRNSSTNGQGFWSRRNSVQTQERLAHLTDLMTTMQSHFEIRERQADQMNASISNLTQSLERISEAQHRTARSIDALTGHVETSAHRSESLVASMAELPAALQAQAEAVHSVGRGLDSAAQSEARVSAALEQLLPAVDSLSGAGAENARAIKAMIENEARQRETLRALVKQQNRRMIIVMIAVGLLVCGCMGLLAWTILTRPLAG